MDKTAWKNLRDRPYQVDYSLHLSTLKNKQCRNQYCFVKLFGKHKNIGFLGDRVQPGGSFHHFGSSTFICGSEKENPRIA